MTWSPSEVWQYGAALLVVLIVLTGLHVFKRLAEAAIEAFRSIANRIDHHEARDTERHNDLLEVLHNIRVKQESKPQ